MEADHGAIAEVLRAEREWAEAHERLDVAAIARMMGEDYTIIRPGGRVAGRVEALASYAAATREWESARSDELDIRVYGDVAVVIGRWVARGVNAGEHFDYQARYMAVWVRRAGRWQIAADQSTTIE